MIQTTATDQQKHSAAHILAMAVGRLYKNLKIGIGPVTKEGFYYDLDVSQQIKEEDFEKIENEINKIIQEGIKFQQMVLPRDEAINMLLQRGQIYKAELIKAIPDQEISFFKTGEEFIDLCRGPHIANTNQVGIIKLTKVEQVHWNEDINRPKINRVHGKVFSNLEELNNYNKLVNDLRHKNYRALSKKYRLATIVNGDVPALTERGTIIYNKISKILNSQFDLKNYKELILNFEFTNEIEADKVFNNSAFSKNISYRDFPILYHSFINTKTLSFLKHGTHYNIEIFKNYVIASEAFSGLGSLIDNTIKAYKDLGIELSAEIISNNPDEAITVTTSNIFQRNMVSHNKIIANTDSVNVFFKSTDKFGKEWILGYIKFDPIERKDTSGILAIEFGFIMSELWKYLVEKNEGIFPTKLIPIDLICIPVNKKFYDYAFKICEVLKNNNYNCEVDNKSLSLKYKIKRAEKQHIPVQLIIGEKESLNNSVSVRENHIDAGLVKLDNLIEHLNKFFENK